MDREQLKGQQTPGRWVVITSWNDYMITAEGQDDDAIIWQDGAYDTPTMTEADATLMAEAGTVANLTGLWPEDLLARIKELEEALACCEYAMTHNRPHSEGGERWEWGDVLTHARAILNKR